MVGQVPDDGCGSPVAVPVAGRITAAWPDARNRAPGATGWWLRGTLAGAPGSGTEVVTLTSSAYGDADLEEGLA
jgi:hypothetical protein